MKGPIEVHPASEPDVHPAALPAVRHMRSPRTTGDPHAGHQVTEFGAFRLDPAERLLLREGQPVALTPKAFDLLLYLVDRAGRLVEKQAVMAALWPDAIVEEGNLASTVSALRKALGDEEQRVIATVPTRGYRFVVPVVRGEALAVDAAVHSSNLPQRSAIRTAGRIAAIALWSAVMVTVGWIISRQVGRAPTTTAMFLRVGIEPAEGIRGSGLHSERWVSRNRPTRTAIALSPDGRSLVFAGVRGDQQQLWLRPMDRADATAISGTEEASTPFFSPDGRWIGFWSRGSLWRVPVAGGAPMRICDALLSYGASWGTDDFIVYADGEAGGLRRVAAAGGVPERLTTVNVAAGEGSHRLPHVLPGARAVLFTVVVVPTDTRLGTHVVVQSLDTGDRRLLVRDAADGRYLPTGHLVYVAGGTLMAAPFDLATLRVTGDSAGLVSGVMRSVRTAAAQFAVSDSGSLAWLPAVVDPEPERLHTVVWVDHRGRSTRIEAAPDTYYRPRLSPNGQQIAMDTVESVAAIWIHDIRSARRTRVPFDGYANSPLWTPDGTQLVFSGARAGSPNLFSIATDGSAPAERMSTSDAVQFPAAWTPDGRVLVYHQCAPQCDIWALSVGGKERKAWPVIESDHEEWYATLSPDGKWLAYMSNGSGRHEVYVQSFPGPGARHAISAEGGMFPRWSPDGSKLYYVATSVIGPLRVTLPAPAHTGNTYLVVDVSTSRGFTASAPRVVFEDPEMKYTVTNPIAGYDVAPDGRFLMVETKRRAGLVPPPPADVRLILNWSEQVRARVRTR